jgi:hypothetical protein
MVLRVEVTAPPLMAGYASFTLQCESGGRRQILPYFSGHFTKTYNIFHVQQADRYRSECGNSASFPVLDIR